MYASTLYNAAFVGAFRGATHLVDNYLNPVGIVKSIKDNFYNEWKRIGLGFLPGYALDANGITNIMGLPTFALNAFPLGLYNAIKPTQLQRNHLIQTTLRAIQRHRCRRIQPKMKQKLSITMDEETVHDIDNSIRSGNSGTKAIC